ncbi:hypothetical protein JL100_032055 (plasmid) [Skermanella mucosa]|uniref:hypothetical protein n=1 Tax=Skermanella mucosa TaxID=1789672 RepID=UPI00192C5C3F|nr:hypothetical protein [Skermanella mucosa]UEM24275.1 hypothetical protein JL100_032055 [Skermanella mucosa]
MNRNVLTDAIKSIDEAAAGPCSLDQARRLAVIRAQLWLLARETSKEEGSIAAPFLIKLAAE